MGWFKEALTQIGTSAALDAIGNQNTVRFQQVDYSTQGQVGQVLSLGDSNSQYSNNLPDFDKYGNANAKGGTTSATPSVVTVALNNGQKVTVSIGTRDLVVGDIVVVYGGVAH